jgi:cobalt-zinc-cadmium efflux system protein
MGITHHLKEKFGVQHATLQVETDPGSACALAPDHVV